MIGHRHPPNGNRRPFEIGRRHSPHGCRRPLATASGLQPPPDVCWRSIWERLWDQGGVHMGPVFSLEMHLFGVYLGFHAPPRAAQTAAQAPLRVHNATLSPP